MHISNHECTYVQIYMHTYNTYLCMYVYSQTQISHIYNHISQNKHTYSDWVFPNIL